MNMTDELSSGDHLLATRIRGRGLCATRYGARLIVLPLYLSDRRRMIHHKGDSHSRTPSASMAAVKVMLWCFTAPLFTCP